MEVSRTLVETGRSPGPGSGRRPVDRDDGARRRLREQQLAQAAAQRDAAEALAAGGVHGRVLSERETAVLLRAARPGAGRPRPAAGRGAGGRLGARRPPELTPVRRHEHGARRCAARCTSTAYA